jgi:hypothetical protein
VRGCANCIYLPGLSEQRQGERARGSGRGGRAAAPVVRVMWQERALALAGSWSNRRLCQGKNPRATEAATTLGEAN